MKRDKEFMIKIQEYVCLDEFDVQEGFNKFNPTDANIVSWD